MQEKLAKTKTCPFIQNGLLVGASIKPVDAKDMEQFRCTTVPANITCITTQCMAWRKTYTMDDTNTDGYCHLLEKK